MDPNATVPEPEIALVPVTEAGAGPVYPAAFLGKVWEVGAWRERGTIGGFLLGAHGVAFSPDDERLALCGNAMDAVKLWDIKGQQTVLRLKRERSIFRPAEFSPDGDCIGAPTSVGHLTFGAPLPRMKLWRRRRKRDLRWRGAESITHTTQSLAWDAC